MSTFRVAARNLALVTGALAALFWMARPAVADDTLQVITGAQPTAFYQVMDYVAQLGGFFKEEGLTVNINYAGNPTIAAQLIATGKGDISAESLEPLVQGYDKGIRLQTFFLRSPENQYTLGVLANSPIKTLADFKGTTLGEYSPGSSAEPYVTGMLTGAGLRKSDFSFLPIGSGGSAIDAMNKGKVAGAAFPYLELLIYEVNADQHYRFFWNPILKDIGNTGYVATSATIQNKADLLKRFARAIAKATILIKVNPELAARYYVQGAGLKVTDDNIAKEVKLLQLAQDVLPGADPLSKKIGNVPPLGMGIMTKFMYEQGLTTTLVPASAVMSDAFIDYANDFDHAAFVAQAKKMKAPAP
jgi:NitT/TauT family transport system substrate-binding protein